MAALKERLSPWTQTLLDVLTDREREAVILRQSGMTFEQAASVLEVTIARARALADAAAKKMTSASERAVLLHRHVPAVEPHPRPCDCAAKQCKVPASMMKALDLPASMLSLGSRAHRCLETAGIEYVGQIVKLFESDILHIQYLGRKTLKNIKGGLRSVGLHLGMDVGDWRPPHGPQVHG